MLITSMLYKERIQTVCTGSKNLGQIYQHELQKCKIFFLLVSPNRLTHLSHAHRVKTCPFKIKYLLFTESELDLVASVGWAELSDSQILSSCGGVGEVGLGVTGGGGM